MKKIIFALVVLLLASPAWAEVAITCANSVVDGNNYITVGYDATTEANLVRAVALEITLSGDGEIEDVNCLSKGFGYHIYLGSIDIDSGGDVDDYGTCKCDGDKYPETPDDVNMMTVEMASLYEKGVEDEPCKTGDLVSFMVTGTGEVCVSIAENEIRGGTVMERAAEIFDLSLPDPCCINLYAGCLPLDDPSWQNWDDVGQPGSWCCDYHALGDTNGDGAISALDLFLCFKPAYNTQHGVDPAYDPDADFNHDKAVSALDLFLIFKPNYNTNPGPGYDCPHD